MSWYDWLIVVVAFERLAELIVSQRHVTWAFAHGGIETASGTTRRWSRCTPGS